MNQGMYGMASSNASSNGRKLIYKSPQLTNTYSPINVLGNLAIPTSLTTPTSGVRTKLFSITGKGAIRFAAIQMKAATTTTNNLELVVDGVTVYSSSSTTNATSQGIVAVGWLRVATEFLAIPDWVPFDSSAEMYITQTVGVEIQHAVAYDLHQ